MKRTFLAFFSIIFIALTFFAIHPAVFADDVVIATQSGATYLTTTTTTTTTVATTSATPVPAAGVISVPYIGSVVLPSGFFPSVSALTNNIFRVIMVVAVVLVFAYLVLGGIQYITSGGEKAKTEAARNKIISAIVGLLIVASSYAILTLVLNFIGYRDVGGLLEFTPAARPVILATPLPTPTPTPGSPLQQLLQK